MSYHFLTLSMFIIFHFLAFPFHFYRFHFLKFFFPISVRCHALSSKTEEKGPHSEQHVHPKHLKTERGPPRFAHTPLAQRWPSLVARRPFFEGPCISLHLQVLCSFFCMFFTFHLLPFLHFSFFFEKIMFSIFPVFLHFLFFFSHLPFVLHVFFSSFFFPFFLHFLFVPHTNHMPYLHSTCFQSRLDIDSEDSHPSCVAQPIRRCQEQSCAQDTEQTHGNHGSGALLSLFPVICLWCSGNGARVLPVLW